MFPKRRLKGNGMPAAHDIKKLSGYGYSYFVSQRKFSFCCFQLFVPLAALCVPFGFVLRAFPVGISDTS